MRAVIQRVSRAALYTDGRLYSEIKKGIVILFCVENGDTEKDSDYIEKKIINLRIFPDDNNKMNLSICDMKGDIMLVSQFTLAGDARKGTRPSYSDAAHPDKAVPIYEDMIKRLSCHANVSTGIFGADMQIELVNDGPVTILLDSRKRF